MQQRVFPLAKTLGGNANPFDAFMLISRMKTRWNSDGKTLRQRHGSSVFSIATELYYVNYTGLPQHPDFATAARQMRHPGAMLSFELKGGLQGGIDFMNRLEDVCTHRFARHL